MYSTFKNVFTVFCSIITLFMIYQLLVTFVVKKPTTSSEEEKELEITDLPVVAICLEDGYNDLALAEHGYHIGSYYRGALQPNSSHFIGWSGEKDEKMSSGAILEETLVLPKSEELIISAGFTRDNVNFEKADVSFSTFGHKIGRCMLISPPPNATYHHRLSVRFNDTVFHRFNLSSVKMRIYLMDKANSPQLYPDEMEMAGSSLWVGLDRSFYMFQTRISKSVHVDDDPLFDCDVYTQENSYDKCIRKDIKALFAMELGCQPPYLSENKDDICNKKFNVSDSRSIEIFSLFWHLLFKDMKYTCTFPCTKTTYTTRDRGADPYPFKTLDITFDQTVDLTHSKFSIDSYTFLTKLGGFIGIGRSSLWLFVSLLGVVQVQCKFHLIYFSCSSYIFIFFSNFSSISGTMYVSFYLFPGDEETKGLGEVDKKLLQNRATGQEEAKCST